MRHSIIITDEGYGGLNPKNFGYEDCEPCHAFGPAVRRFWLLHFVVSGFGTYRIGEREYRVGPGEIFVIPPFATTYYEADGENPWHYVWVGFTSEAPLPLPLGDTFSCPKAQAIFQEMKKCEERSGGRSAFLSAKLWELFSLLLDKNDGEKDYVEEALDCIHSEYMNDITVEQIARRLNLDRTYFSVIFKRKTGIPPKQYLVNYRMSVAASLMTENKTSVSTAACSVGYPDVFSFSKMFKRHFGLSPGDYVRKKENA